MKAWRLGAGVANATLRLIGAPTRRWRFNKHGASKAGMKAKAIILKMQKAAAKKGRRAFIAPLLGEQRLAVPPPEQGGRYTQNDAYYARLREQAEQSAVLAFVHMGALSEPVPDDEPRT